MSILLLFFKSILIGLAIAAPIGPVGVICIKKTLENGLKGSIFVGLGAALADALYGSIAALGLSTITHFLAGKAFLIKLIGGFFLLYLAYKELSTTNSPAEVNVKSKNHIKLVSDIFFLTITNPMTILSFIGIFASINNDGADDLLHFFVMIIGIFVGSMTWWLILGNIIIKIKHKLPKIWLERIRYFSSLIIGGFGIYAVASAMQSIL